MPIYISILTGYILKVTVIYSYPKGKTPTRRNKK